MYITPQTDVRLLKNVPLDNTYSHTIYFSSKSSQSSYFTGLVKHTLYNYTYQRVNKGVCRVGLSADVCYDCNYMMFRNTAYGSKWFYAFITGVEYVNDVTCEIRFEIDVMQTWHFDYTIPTAFIERQHVTIDTPGTWLQPENVDLGPYVNSHETPTNLFDSYSVVIITSDVGTSDPPNGMIGGMYSGCRYVSGLADTEEQVELLNQYLISLVDANNVDAVVAILYVPTSIIPKEAEKPRLYEAEIDIYNTEIDGYVPRNKKLLTYPYNFLYVSNNQGNGACYKYELFTTTQDDKIIATVATQFSAAPEIGLFFLGYAGEVADYDSTLFIRSFPQCSFAYDTFRAWVAQGGGISAVTSLLGGAATMATGGAKVGNVLGAYNTVEGVVQAAIQPNTLKGSVGGSWYVANKFIDYRFMQRHITKQFAMIIDDYFDKWGYAYERFGTVNRNARPHWNYVKTRDLTLKGSVPADDMAKIISVYNNGVTFWNNGAEVGDYSLDNSI